MISSFVCLTPSVLPRLLPPLPHHLEAFSHLLLDQMICFLAQVKVIRTKVPDIRVLFLCLSAKMDLGFQ